MAWSTPLTAVANTALTAAQWNASVRDNLLQTAPALVSAAGQIVVSTGANVLAARTPTASNIVTAESTATTTYTDLTTVGPAITATTGTQAFSSHKAASSNGTANNLAQSSVAVSGATTLAAQDQLSAIVNSATAGQIVAASAAVMLTALTGGSNTFTVKYRATPAGTATFSQRHLVIIPL